jgi:hypothetical protein
MLPPIQFILSNTGGDEDSTYRMHDLNWRWLHQAVAGGPLEEARNKVGLGCLILFLSITHVFMASNPVV